MTIGNNFKLCLIASLLMGYNLNNFADENIPDGYRTGQWIEIPAEFEAVDKLLVILKDEPKVTMTGEWTAQVDFETVIPVHTPTIYYGVYGPDALLEWPHYLWFDPNAVVGTVPKSGELTTQHSIAISAINVPELGGGFFLTSKVDVNNMKEKGGGVVVYQLEIDTYEQPQPTFYSPRASFYNGQFEFYNGKLVPTVIEGPFVDQITETSAIISWETDQLTRAEVVVDGLKSFSAGDVENTHFEVKLTGLTPGALYDYSVNLLDKGHDNPPRKYFFQTPAENTTKFNFASLGDSRAGYGGGELNYNGVNATVLRSLVSNAYVKDARFIVHTGDLVDGYVSSAKDFEMQLKAYKDVVGPVGHYLPMYEMMGNHEVVVNYFPNKDDATGMGKRDGVNMGKKYDMITKEGAESAEVIFGNEFVNPTNGPMPDNIAANAPEGKSLPPYKENVYFVDYGNCRLIMMNNNYWFSGLAEKYGGSPEGYIMDDQKNWLLGVFEDTKNDDSIEHLFIFAQEPMFPVASQSSNAGWYNGGSPDSKKNKGYNEGDWDRTYVYKRRDEIWKAFIETGKAVAGNFGDEHNFSRTLITHNGKGEDYAQPVWQIVTGGAGAPYANQEKDGEDGKNVPWEKDVKYFTIQHSYALYRVDGSRIMFETYNIDDILLDSIELTKDTTRAGLNIATSSTPTIEEFSVKTAAVSQGQEGLTRNELVDSQTIFEVSVVPLTESKTVLEAGEEMEIEFSVFPTSEDVGQAVEFVTAIYADDSDVFYMRDGSGWKDWDGKFSNLLAFASTNELPEVLDGSLTLILPTAGEYTFFAGYRKNDGSIVYNGEQPLNFTVK